MQDESKTVDCGTAMRQLWEYLDGELDAERERAIRQHLEVCTDCYPHYDFEKLFLEGIAAARRGEGAPAALRARVERALREEGFAPGRR